MRVTIRLTLLIFVLYGLLFAVSAEYMARVHAPLWAALVFTVIMAAAQFWYAPRMVEWLFPIVWDDDAREFPVRNREFLQKLCAERGLKMPRIGIMHSAAPNAFAFGHWPGDARIVVTTGLIQTLNVEEANSVLAHELGHVEHWDFVVMTVAALVPLLLYQIYTCALRANSEGQGDRSKIPLLAESAYAGYLASELVVLWLGRTREYLADQYSAHVTGTPNALATALVKIVYGMAKADGDILQAIESASPSERSRWNAERGEVRAMTLMGIANIRSGQVLALGNGKEPGALMSWDLINPWAKFFEWNSTHPLTALRVRALNEEAERMHQAPVISMPPRQPRDWMSFPVEFALWIAPGVTGILFLGAWLSGHAKSAQTLLFTTGAAWMLRTWIRYAGTFRPATVRSLMSDGQVSPMRPRAIQLRGRILGHGIPGAIWCPDLVLGDDTGMLYVLYRQSIPLKWLFFAIADSNQYVGKEVVITGWFRRGIKPYVEIESLAAKGFPLHRSYSRNLQYGAALLLLVWGIGWRLLVR